MITRAPRWRGTAINSIAKRPGCRCGMGADSGTPDVVDITGLVPQYGPDANVVAPLQIGQLAQQVASSGAYSINPSTGQLQQNWIPGISNQTLLLAGGAALGLALFMGIARGRR
jgi:hypothetical protein